MTTATELVSAPAATPPYDIVRAAYAELRVTDLAASERFYVDLLGMVVAERTSDALYLRGWEERLHHSLVLRRGAGRGGRAPGLPGAPRGGPRPPRSGSRRARAGDGVGARARTRRRASVARLGPVRLPARVLPPDGASRDAAPALRPPPRRADPSVRPPQPAHPADRGRLPLLDRSRLPLLGVHLDRRRRRAHHRRLARCASRASTTSPSRRAAGRGCTTPRSGSASRRASCAPATSSPRPASANAIERGPGRHGVSNAFFVYLRDPDGHRIELYSCDYYTGDPDHKPLRWSVNDVRCRSFWGTRAPGQLVRRVLAASSGPTARSCRPRTPPSTSATSTRGDGLDRCRCPTASRRRRSSAST